jgi:hypothetical protein
MFVRESVFGVAVYILPHTTDDLAAQVELSRAEDKIWSALLKGDLAAVRKIVDKDHDACFERGGVGEVPLHLAFLYNSDKHFEIAQFLIDRAPECLTAVYENPLYQGENALHIAIVNKRIDWCSFLNHVFFLSHTLFLAMHWSFFYDPRRTIVLPTNIDMHMFASFVPHTRSLTNANLERPRVRELPHTSMNVHARTHQDQVLGGEGARVGVGLV